jgi:hypothetical protein
MPNPHPVAAGQCGEPGSRRGGPTGLDVGRQARCDTLQKAGDGSAGVWSAAVMVSMQLPFERDYAIRRGSACNTVAKHNLQASDMKLYIEA